MDSRCAHERARMRGHRRMTESRAPAPRRTPADLVDVAKLVTAYYTTLRPGSPRAAVASRHLRASGSSFSRRSTRDTILAPDRRL